MSVNTLESLEELVENFSLFDDWEDRYKYLIDLGKRLPELDDSFKTDEFLVRGCTSQVWLVPQETDSNKFSFKADSDAMIVKGLIYILKSAFDGKDIQSVRSCDIEGAFDDMGLLTHLSPNRRNGFFAMVERVRSLTGT